MRTSAGVRFSGYGAPAAPAAVAFNDAIILMYPPPPPPPPHTNYTYGWANKSSRAS